MRVTIIRAWQGLDVGQRALIAQLLRYGIVGVGVTSFQTGVFNLLIGAGRQAPMTAIVLATAAAMVVGYTIHSRFTFVGHGERGSTGRTVGRFFVANMLGFAVNSLWVWLFTGVLRLSPHLVSLPMFFVTPAMLFWLNRQWVFD